MKRNTLTPIPGFLLALAFGLATQGLQAADTVVYEAQPTGSEMRIDGTATGKTWACIGKLIAGAFEAEAAWQKDPSLKSVTTLGAGKAPKAEISIPIRSLKSQAMAGASIMDRRMQKEMKAELFPKIEYKLTEMLVKGEVPASGSPVTFDTKGKLAISGVTNEVSFPITMERDGAETLKFKGSYKAKMTAFGITPPEFALLGVGLKTGDDITLTWTWTTALKKTEAK
jgi:hypothetical protein